MNSPQNILHTFIETRLGGDIDKLSSFHLKILMNDEVYGCPNRKFDADDTNLMRAIYCLVFGDVWPNLTMDNSGDGKMRGDTINSSGTFFSYPWNDKFSEKWNPSRELKEEIKQFQIIFHTIGNMTVLPDKRIGEWSINKHRGCHDEWHDYEDRFLSALHKVLMQMPDADRDLMELVSLNDGDFRLFYGEKGWQRFIDGNLLEDYVDENCVPVIKSKGYTWWRGGYINRERFFNEAHRYIADSTHIIEHRGKRMVEILKTKL